MRFTVLLAMLGPAIASAQYTLPDRSYAADTVGTVISTQMEEVHHNQPSIVNGALLLAGNGVHAMYDIADPFAPVRLSGLESPHHANEAESHQVALMRDLDGTLYALMISGRGVDVFDVTDPAAPRLVSALEIEGIDYGDNTEAVWGVAWQGQTIYVGGTNTGLHVVDASDPSSLRVVFRLTQAELGGVDAGPIFALGNLMVVTTPKERAGIATLDLREPRQPSLLDFVLPTEEDSYIGGFYGRHAFLITPLRAYDVTTDPSNISLVASTVVPPSEYMSFGDGYLFLGSLRPNPGVYKYDISDLAAPVMVQRVYGRTQILEGLFTDDQFSIPIGNLVVLSDDENILGSVIAVHDARRDSRPPEVAYLNPADGASAQPLSTVVGFSFTDQIDLRSVTEQTLIVRPVGGAPLRGRISHDHTLLSFAPELPLEPDTTYEVLLPAGGITDLVGNPIAEEHRTLFSTGADVRAPACTIEATSPALVGADVTLRAQDAGAATYRWEVDGTTIAGLTAVHAFTAPGRHPVVLTVTSADGSRTCSAIQIVHRPLAEMPPSRASTVVADEARGLAFVVGPDSNTVAAVELDTDELRYEVMVGDHPRTLAQAPDGSLWVACQGSDEIAILDPETGTQTDRIALRYGAAPFGLAFAPDGARVYATLEATGQLLAIDPARREIVETIALEGRVRGLAVAPDGRVYVARLVSPEDHGEVFEIDGRSVRTIELARDPGPDTGDSGRGVPNYLGAIAISPDGTSLLVPSKKDNTERGLARDGEALDPVNTVRTIVSRIDLAAGAEVLAARIDLDDHDMASAVAFSPLGDLVFIATQGTNRVDVYDTASGRLVSGFATGLAPQGLWMSGERLYAQSFMSRTLDVYDVRGLLAGTDGAVRSLASITTVGTEPLTPEVLLGKQIFYNADDPRMSLDGYLACATCHLDGGSDGRVWDFTDRGEGFRDTIDLRGRAGIAHGPVHWTGNFDEIQDFENDIRLHFGGRGLMSAEAFDAARDPLAAPKAGTSATLDALAAYVSTLDSFAPSPWRNEDGTMTEAAVRGRAIFERLDCRSCHRGERLTDSAVGVLHDVGTARATSGSRLGEPLIGFDTPTLRGLWGTAPYLHDGSAASLEDVLANPEHGDAASLPSSERDDLVAFLRELDDDVLGYTDAPGGCGCRATRPTSASWMWLAMLAVLFVRRRAR